MSRVPEKWMTAVAAASLMLAVSVAQAESAPKLCAGKATVAAHVVAMDQSIFVNRMGSSLPAGMIYALASDVFPQGTSDFSPAASCAEVTCTPGQVRLRPDKRPRPIVLRANEGNCLKIELTNLISPTAPTYGICSDLTTPCDPASPPPDCGTCQASNCTTCSAANGYAQPSTRAVGIHVQGLPWAGAASDDGAYVGQSCDSFVYPSNSPKGPGYCAVNPGNSTTYWLFAEHEGGYFLYSAGDDFNNLSSVIRADGGTLQVGLFGAVNVQPSGFDLFADLEALKKKGKAPVPALPEPWQSGFYRSQVTQVDLCLSQVDAQGNPAYTYQPPQSQGSSDLGSCTPASAGRLPKIDYQAVYPTGHPRAGQPILNMVCTRDVLKNGGTCTCDDLVYSDLTAVITGPTKQVPGFKAPQPQQFPEVPDIVQPPSLRPVYASPLRLQPYREFTIIYHEAYQLNQAFAKAMNTTPSLTSAIDNFGINYGMGAIAAPVVGNRLGVGPMGNCLDCKYEEFFLSSWPLGDPAMNVDVPTSSCVDGNLQPIPGCCAHKAFYPDDPSNVYHAYMSDHVKFRINHAGPDLHHLHHQHAHQWLGTPNSPSADYLDSQSIGPGSSFTLEMVYNGSGNVNQTVGDSIFHCHFYPHFASGMWALWRVHDVFEAGTRLGPCADPTAGYGCAVDDPQTGNRALPDAEIADGTPSPALVPMPTLPMAPEPAPVRLADDGIETEFQIVDKATGKPACADPEDCWVPALSPQLPAELGGGSPSWRELEGKYRNPGYPYFVPGIAGSRAPHPPGDLAWAYSGCSDSQFDGSVCDTKEFGKPDTMPVAGGPFAGCTCNDPLDGGLPRSVFDHGTPDDWLSPPLNNTDFSKKYEVATANELPQSGTLVENVAMATHAQRLHYESALPDGTTRGVCSRIVTTPGCQDVGNGLALCGDEFCQALGGGKYQCENLAPCSGSTPADLWQCRNSATAQCAPEHVNFVLNGLDPIAGAPFADPCILFDRLGGSSSAIGGSSDRDYLGVDVQFDAVFNREGWHFPQQRIITLWGDAQATLDGQRPPEPLFMRVNSYDCMNYTLANLVPNVYELDDFQVRTPTDILGQHIHLVKFDVTSSDGAANGWNYEDGTFAPNEVTERINAFNAPGGEFKPYPGSTTKLPLKAKPIAFFGPGPGAQESNPLTGQWLGSQATVQRWYDDPQFNNLGRCSNDLTQRCTLAENGPLFKSGPLRSLGCGKEGLCDLTAGYCSNQPDVLCTENTGEEKCGKGSQCLPFNDRTFRTVFTHDHFGPSTHQQAGLYAGVVAEPKGSLWLDNQTGQPMGGYDDATGENVPSRSSTENDVTVFDGGPTSWQAVIQTPNLPGGSVLRAKLRREEPAPRNESFREFLFMFQDTTLTYEPFTVKAYDSDAWDPTGSQQFAGGVAANCDADGHEPCGYCSYRGVCSDNGMPCLIAPPAQGLCNDGSGLACFTSADCTSGGGTCVRGTCTGNSGQICFTTQDCQPQGADFGVCTQDISQCGSAEAICQLRFGQLISCDPENFNTVCYQGLPQGYDYDSTPQSCNFVAGVPSQSWAPALTSISSPLSSDPGTGPGIRTGSNQNQVATVEAITFGGGTFNFSTSYRNEPFYPRTTDPVTGLPLPGELGDLSWVYSSNLDRPSPRGSVCSDTLAACDPSQPSPCGAGATCDPAGFCNSNWMLCSASNTNNCTVPACYQGRCNDGSACASDADCKLSCVGTTPGDKDATPYAPLTAGIEPTDPFTPLIRTYVGDDVQLRWLVGAHINPHNLTLHGLNWLKEPSFVDSGWQNSEVMGISEHFEALVKIDPPYSEGTKPTDYLYMPGAAAIEQASGNWGLLRSYREPQETLTTLPQNPHPELIAAVPICPQLKDGTPPCGQTFDDGTVFRCYDVVALTGHQALGTSQGSGNQGKLFYNFNQSLSNGQALLYFNVEDPGLSCTDASDPRTCTYVRGFCSKDTDQACRTDAAAPAGCGDCIADPDPLTLRANSGDCIQVTLHNALVTSDLKLLCSADGAACPTYGAACGTGGICQYYGPDNGGYCGQQVGNSNTACQAGDPTGKCLASVDCYGLLGTGVRSNQLTRQQSVTSIAVGLRPQKVTYDLGTSDGTNAGFNAEQTAAPDGQVTYTWYAGHVDPTPEGGKTWVPIEFGAGNLLPSDKINQYYQGLFGGLIIEPPGSRWDPAAGPDTVITEKDGGQFREYVLWFQDSDDMRLNVGTGAAALAANYKSEYLFPTASRFCDSACTNPFAGGNPNEDNSCMLTGQAYVCTGSLDSNNDCENPAQNCKKVQDANRGFPETPTFTACAGEPVRFRILQPGGTNTNGVFELYGHTFSDAPYMSDPKGDPQACFPPTMHTNLHASNLLGTRNLCGAREYLLAPGEYIENLRKKAPASLTSKAVSGLEAEIKSLFEAPIWEASLNEWKGSLMGVGPTAHYDVLVDSAGGPVPVPGSYLWRTYPSYPYYSGIWGLFNVLDSAVAPPGFCLERRSEAPFQLLAPLPEVGAMGESGKSGPAGGARR